MSQNPRRRRTRQELEEDKASEAEEEKVEIRDESEPPDDEDEGEDLLGDNVMRDYLPRPELDQYEQEGLDDEQDFDDLDIDQRRLAEEEIDERRRRDRLQFERKRQIPQAMRELSEGSDDDEIRREQRNQRLRQLEMERGFEEEQIESEKEESEDQEGDERYLDIEECRGKLKQWINEERTKKWIKRTFKKFLINFKENNDSPVIYRQVISDMCKKNRQSLEIKYHHLVSGNSTLALWVAEEPQLVFPYLNEVAVRVAYRLYPNYQQIQSEIFVRITELPICDLIRELRQKHLGKLIRVLGVITKRSTVYSQMKSVIFICVKCGEKKGPFFLNNNDNVTPGACINCQSNGPFKLDQNEIVYRNFQKITLQESPGSVPPGRVPRQKEVILLGDQIDVARPGDEVEVTGIYMHRYDYALNVKHGFPLFFTIIESNYIKRVNDTESLELPQEEINNIKKLSRDPQIARKIINSVAPSIYGHYNVKTALALAMFGGVSKDIDGKHKIRGDINILLLGDPGTAKSQFLKNVEKTFYRAVYTTGKGASAVGLTASVKRDFSTKEWTLEGGALVLADKGICLIDEFDKMNEHDRTSIHEAMEQQSISISKAGIVANLKARCSVIAAANPVKGKYDSQMSFHENVDLTDPILSRFDVLCVVKDEVSVDLDDALASFVINSHIKNHPVASKLYKNIEKYPQNEKNQADYKQMMTCLVQEPLKVTNEILDQKTLRNYIMYARQKIHPKLSKIDNQKIVNFYTKLRQESEVCGGINIAIRHLESIIRMSEAHAKIHLRDDVNDYDVSVAISVMLESFIQSQKFSIAKILKKKFYNYLTFREESHGLIMSVIDRLYRERMDYNHYLNKQQERIYIPIELIEKESKFYKIDIPEDFYQSFNFTRVYTKQGDKVTLQIGQ